MSGLQVAHRAEACGEWLASRPSGQLVFRGVDSVLRLVEKTLMWSTQSSEPSGNVSENGTGASFMLVSRPLPWPLFLPLLGFLGVLRVSVYYGTRIFRKPHDTKDMIHWLQAKRRRLRAIKYAGLKNIRSQQNRNKNEQSIENQSPATVPNSKTPSKEVTVGVGDSPDQEKKRKYCDVEQSDITDDSDDEGVAVKLDKYGEEYDSETDPDYVLSSDTDSSEDEDVDGEGEDEDDLKKDAGHEEKVNGESAALDPAPAAPEALHTDVPSIVTVEPVSEHGKANSESSGSGSLTSTSPFSVRAKLKLAKLFKSASKTKQ